MFRSKVHKGHSARKFRSQVRRTRGANVAAVHRGGICL